MRLRELALTAATLGSLAVAGADGAAALRPACPRLGEAPKLPVWQRADGVLRGDVDADGRQDSVSIRYAPGARASCGFFLVVRTQRRAYSERLPEWYKPPDDLSIRYWSLHRFPDPSLVAVVQLERRRLQIAVTRWHGASNVGVSLHGIVNGRLEQLRFHPRFYRDELGLGGAAGIGVTSARCVRGGPLILVGEWPTPVGTGWRWSASRTTYVLSGNRFTRGPTQILHGSQQQMDAAASRWGFSDRPFVGCRISS